MKFYYTFLLFLVIGTTIVAQKNEIPLWFTDADFEKNINRWHQVKEFGEIVFHNALYINPNKDFRIVVEFDSKNLKKTEAIASWGLSWGRKNAYSYYHFEINKKQEFRIGYRKGLDFHPIESWVSKQKIIQKDHNILEVRHVNGNLFFLINDKIVSKMDYRPFQQSTVAMRTTSNSVQFKRFSIYQDMGKINLVTTQLDSQLVAENLGAKVNSKFVDKAPVISPDGKTLYFIREDATDGFGLQDIYFSTYQKDSGWAVAQNIGRPLNNRGNNFINAVMPDNNTLMAINSYARKDLEEILAFTYRTPEGWSTPKPKKISNLRKTGRWVSFDLAADGKTIVYAIKRQGTAGGRDLYVSFLQENGNFSPPKNLGKTINTMGNEHCPFLAADGKTLYFDSDGHPGYGGRDIFMSKRLDDSWTNWSVPQNLGSQINTKGADEGLVIPASGEYAYFVSDKNTLGGLDLFRLKLPEALRPEPTAMLTGYVVDCQNQRGISTIIKVYIEGNAKEFAVARTNPNNGAYKLALVKGAKYLIVADYNSKLEITNRDTIRIDLTTLDAYKEEELKPICFQPKTDSSKSIKIPIRAYIPNFKSVYFDNAKYQLTSLAQKQLKQMADTLKVYPTMQIKVLGHTDSNGSNSYNWALAIKRSVSVITYLEKQGIERKRLDFKGLGETSPIANNATNDGRANNRRVAFEIIKKF